MRMAPMAQAAASARHAGTKQSNARLLTVSGASPWGPHQRLLLRCHQRRRPGTADAAAGPRIQQSRSRGPHHGLHTPVTLSCRAECNTGAHGQSFRACMHPCIAALLVQIRFHFACMCHWRQFGKSSAGGSHVLTQLARTTLGLRGSMHAAQQQVSCAPRISQQPPAHLHMLREHLASLCRACLWRSRCQIDARGRPPRPPPGSAPRPAGTRSRTPRRARARATARPAACARPAHQAPVNHSSRCTQQSASAAHTRAPQHGLQPAHVVRTIMHVNNACRHVQQSAALRRHALHSALSAGAHAAA